MKTSREEADEFISNIENMHEDLLSAYNMKTYGEYGNRYHNFMRVHHIYDILYYKMLQ